MPEVLSPGEVEEPCSVLPSSRPAHSLTLTHTGSSAHNQSIYSQRTPGSQPAHLLTHLTPGAYLLTPRASTHTQPTCSSQPLIHTQLTCLQEARARQAVLPEQGPLRLRGGPPSLRGSPRPAHAAVNTCVPLTALTEVSGLSTGRRPTPPSSLWPPATQERHLQTTTKMHSGFPVLFPRPPLWRVGPHVTG